MRRRKGWKIADIKTLRSLINDKSNVELAEQFNCTTMDISSAMQRYKIVRDPEFVKKLMNPTGTDAHNYQGGVSKNNSRYLKRQRAKDPEKSRARNAVQRAVKTGKLIKPDCCSKCNAPAKNENDIHFHHTEGYATKDKYLIGKWLCRKCHREAHGNRH